MAAAIEFLASSLNASPRGVHRAVRIGLATDHGGSAVDQAAVLWVALAVVGILAIVNTLVISGMRPISYLDNHYQPKEKSHESPFCRTRIIRGTGRL